MKTLKNRRAAVTLTVVLCAVFALVGVHRSLAAQTARVTRMFYDGIYLEDAGYTQPGIDTHLKARADAALGLVTLPLSKRWQDLADDIRAARQSLLVADSVSAKRAANDALDTAFYALASKLLTLEDETDAARARRYADTFAGAGFAMEGSAYNAQVLAFRAEVDRFPVSILKYAAFARLPELF
ncbi:MAG: LemA family protein [Oscillospiraceae bacterium]|jgi:hypothetical protein|nr:LemA family protein [Oscillospiraceae bacterium]